MELEESPAWLQVLLQSHSHQDSMVLAQRQKYKSMEQNRKPRDKPIDTLSMTKEAKSIENIIYHVWKSKVIFSYTEYQRSISHAWTPLWSSSYKHSDFLITHMKLYPCFPIQIKQSIFHLSKLSPYFHMRNAQFIFQIK